MKPGSHLLVGSQPLPSCLTRYRWLWMGPLPSCMTRHPWLGMGGFFMAAEAAAWSMKFQVAGVHGAYIGGGLRLP